MNILSSRTTKGIAVGLFAGLVGSAVKSAVERFLEVRKIDQRSAQLKIIDKFSMGVTGTPMATNHPALVEQLVNLPLGATVGAFYGYQNRKKPRTSLTKGLVLGGTTWITTHETSLPLLGLEQSPKEIPLKTQVHELFAHLIYGVSTELVRSYIAQRMER